jgi:superfamily I DNA/RNA helicase
VLYRTNAQSRAIEESCLRYGIRYQVVGGTRFYARREVKDALAYLRILRSDTLAPTVLAMLDEEVRGLVAEHTAAEYPSEWNRDGLKTQLTTMVPTLEPRALAPSTTW